MFNGYRFRTNNTNKKSAPIPKRRTRSVYGSSLSNTALVETKEIPQKLIDISAYNEAANLTFDAIIGTIFLSTIKVSSIN